MSSAYSLVANLTVSPTGVLFLNLFLFGALLLMGGLVLAATGDRGPGESRRRSTDWIGLWVLNNRWWGLFLLILGVKLYWIHHYNINVPFWDQWDAEGKRLYLPFLAGDLRFFSLFHPHNEHRIFWTRIWGLGQLLANGQWDTRWQVVTNGVLHSATGALVGLVILRRVRAWWVLPWVGLTVLVFAGPQAWENQRFGFQSQFYFLQFFGICAILLLFMGQASRWRRAVGGVA
jgi:hypothetical protein